MKFTINREALLKPLQLVAGVVERKQTLPILANILIATVGDKLYLTGTDLEVELVGCVVLQSSDDDIKITVPARKLVDICKSLPSESTMFFKIQESKVILKAGKSRFTLSSLPAQDFPNIREELDPLSFKMNKKDLRHLIDYTGFSMAQQDVRYYLNGMLLEVSKGCIRSVATDAHRLATYIIDINIEKDVFRKVIIPRKGIMELARLMVTEEGMVKISIGVNYIRVDTGSFLFTSKLVEGEFPHYQKVIPKVNKTKTKNVIKIVTGNCLTLKQAFQRVSILSNEKYKGVKLILSEKQQLKIAASNPEQEEAEEIIDASYKGEPIEIGFNVNYLLDVFSVLPVEDVEIIILDSDSGVLIKGKDDVDDSLLYIIMPMRL